MTGNDDDLAHQVRMQGRKRDLLPAARAAGLFALARRRSAKAVRILCYHGLWRGDPSYPGDSLFMLPSTFQRRLALIRAWGYPVVPLAAAIATWERHGPALPPAAVVITIDDGWASTATHMVPMLAAQGMPVTLYCDTQQLLSGTPTAHIIARYLERLAPTAQRDTQSTGANSEIKAALRRAATDLDRNCNDRLAAVTELASVMGLDLATVLAGRTFDYMTPPELAEAHARGVDVQLHSHRHTLGDLSRRVIENEIAQNRASLSAVLNCAPDAFTHFCYPSGIASPEAAQSLGALGIDSATTTRPGLAWPSHNSRLLPRLLDGENMSEIEFEAELAGFGDWLRAGKYAARRLAGGPARAMDDSA